MKAIREKLGMTQQEFATAVGVAVATVSRWERGKSPMVLTLPQMKSFSRLLRDCGLTIENLPDDIGPVSD